MTMLSMQGVTAGYVQGTRRIVGVDDVTLSVAPGEFVAVSGRSGSGKTTLLNLAGGLTHADTGTVVVDGQDLGELSRSKLASLRRRRIGYVFQDLNLLPTLTATENVRLPLELDGVPVRDADAQARMALSEVLAEGSLDRFPSELSGGEQQRVAIARALVGTRSLVLADEPTGALDELTAEGVLRILRRRAEEGAAVLMVTHAPGQAAWADRVIRLKNGAVESTTSRGAEAPK